MENVKKNKARILLCWSILAVKNCSFTVLHYLYKMHLLSSCTGQILTLGNFAAKEKAKTQEKNVFHGQDESIRSGPSQSMFVSSTELQPKKSLGLKL